MAENLNLIFSLITFIIIIISTSIAGLTPVDLDAAIFALRRSGFDLFSNSIAVSDLSLQVLTHTFNSTSNNGSSVGRHGFTFLAPPNSVLFSLDMATDAFTYVHSLRFHVVPRRLSFAELRNISRSSKPHLETLAPGHVLFVSSSGRRFVSIDGVRVSIPDLYLSPDIAVHGLDGILLSSNEEFFHRLDSVASPPIRIHAPPPSSIDAFSPGIERVAPPIDALLPEIERISPSIDAFSPNFIRIPPFSAEIEGPPPHLEGILEDTSPIGALSPEFGAIPASNDAEFTGGSFNSISVPPIHAFSPEFGARIPASNDAAFTRRSFDSTSVPPIHAFSPARGGIPETPPSTDFLSHNEHSISPTYAGWSDAEFWLPNWNAPPFPVAEWQEYWENINHKKTKKMRLKRKKKQSQLEKGHGYGEVYTESFTVLEERES